MSLHKIFNPKSIAVVGASDKLGSVGFSLIDNLLSSDFRGGVYPVNIKRNRIHGRRAYDKVSEIEKKIDLAIIATPAKTVPAVLEDCGQAGVSGVVIISAGFSEIGKEGEVLSQKILEIAKRYKIRVIGPNCLGFIRPEISLNASFASKVAMSGNLAFVSQSGALCTSVLDWSEKNNIGFSHFISIGSMLDVGFADLLQYLGENDKTDGILIYMESLTEADRFLKLARKIVKKKPIFVLKSGRSQAGSQAAMSHTGSLSGNDEVFTVALESAGIVRIDSISELNNISKFLSARLRPTGDRTAIITNAGGPGVIATDSLVRNQGNLAELSKKTITELNKILPTAWSHANPVDILGDADAKRYEETLKIILSDGKVDSVLVILTPQAMTEPYKVAENIIKLNKKSTKPIYCAWMGGSDVLRSEKLFNERNIPVFSSVEEGIKVITNYNKYLNLKKSKPKGEKLHNYKPKYDKNKKIIDKVISEGRRALSETESKEFLKNYGIPVTKYFIASSELEVKKIIKKIGLPLAMKVVSPDILHKTDVGGVMLDVNSIGEAQKAFKSILTNAKKHRKNALIKGVLLERMVSKDFELIIGVNRDPIFGPVIVFGSGGTSVEVFQDTALALAPLDMNKAEELIEQTKIYQLLKGYRGEKGVNLKNLQTILCKFSRLIIDFPEIKEFDINPFVIDSKGGIVLDAKVVIE